MKTKTLILAWILIGITSVGGMCSKDGDGDGGGNDDGYTEPALKPDATWLYLTSDLPLFYANNTSRPSARKWIASKINTARAFPNPNEPGKDYLSLSFENTDKNTRFLSEALNPGGREYMEISLRKFSKTPGAGDYTMDIDYKEGFCWYEVYKANGDMYDSTRTQSISSSSLNITKMTTLASGGGVTNCLMSGSASIEVMYWANGTGSTTDIHRMQLTFNNIVVVFTE